MAKSVEHETSVRDYIQILGARREARCAERCRVPDELCTATDEHLAKRFRQPR